MESILGKILLGALAVGAGADSEKIADEINAELKKISTEDEKNAEATSGTKRCRADEGTEEQETADMLSDREFAEMARDTDAFRICIEHTAGAKDTKTTIIGHSKDMLIGTAILLSNVVKNVSDGSELKAIAITKAICDFALDKILSGGV